MFRIVQVVVGVVGLVSAVGCAATGPAFKPVNLSDRQAVVYVYRTGNSYEGSFVMPEVKVDGEKVGALKNNGYVYKVLDAGNHEVTCSTETTAKVPFTAEPQKSYYIESGIQMGLFVGRPRLVMVPEETGKLAILGTRCSSQPR